MDVQDVLARLKGVTRLSEGQFMAKCPCHDDKKASLAVRQGEKGVVLHCMAGCQTEDIAKALGLGMKDLFFDAGKAEGKAKGAKAAKGSVKKAASASSPIEPAKKIPASPFVVGGKYKIKETDAETGEITYREETITHVYSYESEDGTPLLQVALTEQKSFPVVYAEGKQ